MSRVMRAIGFRTEGQGFLTAVALAKAVSLGHLGVFAAMIILLVAAPAPASAQQPPTPPPKDHSAHQQPPATNHSAHQPPPPGQPAPEMPVISDADRAAAFPEMHGQHTVHDEAIHYYVLFDQLEWQGGDGVSGLSWDNRGWVGGDVNRFWFRTEGEAEDGRVEAAEVDLLYGRAITPWWDLVAGVRQDVRPGPARTSAAIGIRGLAPYWVEVEALAYVGPSGRTHLHIETEYELLLTNRLVLQPLVEIDLHGKSDLERGIGAGLSLVQGGLRLRYEMRREFAPYLGVTWQRKFFGTADAARAAGEQTNVTRLAAGVRVWF